jgi:hypothetical protein
MRSQFKLPTNTTRKDLLSIPFLEDVFQTALRYGCVREIEWQDFVGLAVNSCDMEKGNPAALFLWTMRNGIRNVKRGTKLIETPWTAAVRNEDMDKARELINQAKPPEYRARTSSLETTQIVAKAEAIKALSAKYGNILGVTR